MSETVASRGPDILVRATPPLSATSDAPLAAAEAPPAAASNDPADQAAGVPSEMSPEAQAAARPPSRETSAEQPSEERKPDDADLDTMDVDGRKVPTPAWAKREITKARNKQREAQAAAEDARVAAKAAAEALAALQAEHAALREKAEKAAEKPTEAAEAPAVADPVVAEAPRPTRDQFDDPESYDEALSEWAARQGELRAEAKLAAERAEAEAAEKAKAEEAQRTAQEAEITRINADWATRKAEAEARYPDFKAVTESESLTISPPVAHLIMTDTNGPEIAYFLGKNPDEATRIAQLPPMRQLYEIGLVAARLAKPAGRATPRPRPLEPIDTAGNAAADSSGREETMEEVAARVNGRYSSARKPFLAVN